MLHKAELRFRSSVRFVSRLNTEENTRASKPPHNNQILQMNNNQCQFINYTPPQTSNPALDSHFSRLTVNGLMSVYQNLKKNRKVIKAISVKINPVTIYTDEDKTG